MNTSKSDSTARADQASTARDVVREAFDAWYSDDGVSPRAVERSTSGSYVLMQTCTAWVAWQAAWKARAALSESEAA